ncbi:hypothetical protein PHYSODRAFT_334464 [Phytophthora sojae]|uniref:Uncharacterized protein n=1 Tax=Phytophthora sojae (strain P6497) TaxID=1094619 RepID=G4ZMT9_PHYSP|nr:hypothetical protein PHYSODRAFT_334464 [Phytophthora sojae]EGZ16287.1 hypothetical protein PHYSODRAFT_334464 [Phytophthora sojae]|eukprot:XP_009530036.1 hypothetical protein PHYSODRAFT_334464 [Phytophthora sojae]
MAERGESTRRGCWRLTGANVLVERTIVVMAPGLAVRGFGYVRQWTMAERGESTRRGCWRLTGANVLVERTIVVMGAEACLAMCGGMAL